MAPDEMLSARQVYTFTYIYNLNYPTHPLQPFVRLSSARSSYASTGWNRYFVRFVLCSGVFCLHRKHAFLRQNRSAHATQDSVVNDTGADLPSLNMLGESSDVNQPAMIEPLDLQEDASSGDFISQFDVMADPRFNYHFAYEGISESDESTSRRNSKEFQETLEVGITCDERRYVYSTTIYSPLAKQHNSHQTSTTKTSSKVFFPSAPCFDWCV